MAPRTFLLAYHGDQLEPHWLPQWTSFVYVYPHKPTRALAYTSSPDDHVQTASPPARSRPCGAWRMATCVGSAQGPRHAAPCGRAYSTTLGVSAQNSAGSLARGRATIGSVGSPRCASIFFAVA